MFKCLGGGFEGGVINIYINIQYRAPNLPFVLQWWVKMAEFESLSATTCKLCFEIEHMIHYNKQNDYNLY
jgi:hypothetical protein